MLQAKSKNRAGALAPFEQQDRDGVRPERPPPRAGRPPARTVGGPMGAACHFIIMGATSTFTHLFVASALDDNSTNVSQVGPGGCPPRPPTDPDVRDYRIRLLGMWLRYARQTE